MVQLLGTHARNSRSFDDRRPPPAGIMRLFSRVSIDASGRSGSNRSGSDQWFHACTGSTNCSGETGGFWCRNKARRRIREKT